MTQNHDDTPTESLEDILTRLCGIGLRPAELTRLTRQEFQRGDDDAD